MSKENIVRFLLHVQHDEELKSKVDGLMNECKKKEIVDTETDRVHEDKILQIAKGAGFELTLEDIKTLLTSKDKKLSDDELEQVAAGRGQITQLVWDCYITFSCERASNTEEFTNYLSVWASENNGCPDFGYKCEADLDANRPKSCSICRYVQWKL